MAGRGKALSGYRITWIQVMFDLLVGTKKERKRATAFRNFLLDLGFEMSQFSVYFRYTASREKAESITRKIEQGMPEAGKVHILYFTDKQYETAISFHGLRRQPKWKNPDQFQLF